MTSDRMIEGEESRKGEEKIKFVPRERRSTLQIQTDGVLTETNERIVGGSKSLSRGKQTHDKRNIWLKEEGRRERHGRGKDTISKNLV